MHAGNTVPHRRRRGWTAAHPHAYGEHGTLQSPIPDTSGSSPHIRGKRALVARGVDSARLIPAHTGKTC